MALSALNGVSQVIATGTGASSHIVLPEDFEYLISFSSAGAFVVDLQVESGLSGKWDDVYSGDTQVTIDSSTGKQNTVVVAGNYRMDVTTYNSPITMYARRV